MIGPLRQVLAESRVAAVTIVILLLWSIDGIFQATREPASRMFSFLATAVAIMGIPTVSPLTTGDRVLLMEALFYLFYAVASFSMAWLLARWVYGAGPLSSLTQSCRQATWRQDV